MNAFDRLSGEHRALKEQAAQLQRAADQHPSQVLDLLIALRHAIQAHVTREEPLYRRLDVEKRADDRESMHRMRNDHAAIIFSLESLLIRLRKTGVNEEWRSRLATLLGVLLPHFDHEDTTIFPKSRIWLSVEELAAIESEMDG